MDNAIAGPRRYSVKFEVPSATVGDILGLLIKEVEGAKVEPTNDPLRFKMSFVAFMSQLSTLLGLVSEHAEQLVVAPYQPQVSAAMIPFTPRPRSVVVPTGMPITHLPSRGNTKGRKFDSQSRTATAILGVLKEKPIAHNPDFADAFEAAGLSRSSVGNIVRTLLRRGLIVRCGYAAYRLPTEQEKAEKHG